VAPPLLFRLDAHREPHQLHVRQRTHGDDALALGRDEGDQRHRGECHGTGATRGTDAHNKRPRKATLPPAYTLTLTRMRAPLGLCVCCLRVGGAQVVNGQQQNCLAVVARAGCVRVPLPLTHPPPPEKGCIHIDVHYSRCKLTSWGLVIT
jgi:hypothetical protein